VPTPIINRKDLSLFTTANRFVLGRVFFESGMQNMIATFDLLVRDLPAHRNYLIFFGLEDIIDYIINLRFTNQQIKWLNNSYNFSPEIKRYFKNFRFTGDVWAMPEGSIFFGGEPIIRITAPLIQAQLLEMFLINAAYFPTIFASKLHRFITASQNKSNAVGYNRSYGVDTAIKAERIKEALGCLGGLALYNYKTGTPTFSTGTYHYLIKAFNNEELAIKTYLRATKGRGYVLVDTYNTINGIKKFIYVAKELKLEKITPIGIQIDSGDHYKLVCQARRLLDQAGLKNAKIFLIGNLDEYKVAKLQKLKAPVDVYSGTTELLTPSDAPTMELVYKLAQLEHNNKIYPKMKTSTAKLSLPGKKQVYRLVQRNKYVKDIIGLSSDASLGQSLLRPIIKKGKLIRALPQLTDIKNYVTKQVKQFDKKLFDVNNTVKYPVIISRRLLDLTKKTAKEILKNN